MSGHNKWKQIKHKKEATDKKRGQAFSKLLKAIRVAAKTESNPEFNPRLRSTIAKAKEQKVPQENIERAIKQSEDKELEELFIEAYGPGGTAIIIEAITDNKNRTINELKSILGNFGGKLAEPGSVRWIFEKTAEFSWQAKFSQDKSPKDAGDLMKLLDEIVQYDDVQDIYNN